MPIRTGSALSDRHVLSMGHIFLAQIYLNRNMWCRQTDRLLIGAGTFDKPQHMQHILNYQVFEQNYTCYIRVRGQQNFRKSEANSLQITTVEALRRIVSSQVYSQRWTTLPCHSCWSHEQFIIDFVTLAFPRPRSAISTCNDHTGAVTNPSILSLSWSSRCL